MKCITCNQEIPDTSNVCPFCNNKVTPAVSASDALGATSVIPQTPDNYVLPKDQIKENTQSIPVQSVEAVQPVEQTNIPAPPTSESVGSETPAVEQPTQEPVQPVEPVAAANIPSPPKMESDNPTAAQTQGEIKADNIPSPNVDPNAKQDPTTINLANVDLNANPQFESYDVTKSGAKDASTIVAHTVDKKKIEDKKKARILLILLVVILIGGGIGLYFYISQYTTASKRIDAAVDRLFSQFNTITNAKVESGSGTYKLDFSSSKNNDNLSFNIEGKYGYDLPNKKIDLISNIKSYNHNEELLDDELNVELYLESNRAYFLLENFTNQYVYTDIDTSKEVIDDIESRFNTPEELLLFNLINTLYDGGLNSFSQDYSKYINNISQNDINYTYIISGLKSATKDALKRVSSTQKFQGGSNVLTINVTSADNKKAVYKEFLNSLKNNKNAYPEILKLFGKSDSTFYNDMEAAIDKIDFVKTGNIVIVTDAFKSTLKSITIPYVKGEDVYSLTITPIGGGYRFVAKQDNKEVLNLSYSTSTSKTSTTETVTYTLKGTIYSNEVANNIDATLELVKDINPSKISVITRNSIDYKFLSDEEKANIANQLREFGNLGVVFNSYYVGPTATTEGEIPVEEPVETPEVTE